MSVTTATTKLLEPVLQLAQHYRLDQDQILSSASLSQAELSKPGARFPTSGYGQILQMLAEATENPRIALSLGEATQPRMLGSIGFLMATADTLGKAYQALIDYLPLLLEGAIIQMEQTVDGTRFSLELNDPELQPVEYLMACLINWPRWLTGHQIPVRNVQLEFPQPNSLLPYQQFFAAEVEFDAPRNQLLFASDYLSLSCLDANPEMHQLHREFADSLLSKSAQQSALPAQTRNLIRSQLAEGSGCVRREQIAESVGLSLRTLQRKLGLLGTNFQDIYDQTRRETCLQLIQRGQISFGEIAFQLGFSNQSAFQKAFKRWMGVAPSQYRQQIKPEAFIETTALPGQKSTNNDWLHDRDSKLRIQKIEERIGQLTNFTLELLEWAALFGEQFSLIELGKVTNNPVARLAIHLWPAEQLGLIDPGPISAAGGENNAVTHSTDEQSGYSFSHPEIRSALYQRLNETEKCKLHRQCGLLLLEELSDDFTLKQITTVLLHLNRAHQQADAAEKKQLRRLNIRAAALAQSEQSFASASRYLSNAYRLLRRDQFKKKSQLLLQRARLHLLAGEIKLAEQCLLQLPVGHIDTLDRAGAALITAEICLHRDQQALGLNHLLENLTLLDPALPEEDNQQLLLLLSQHHEISERLGEQIIPPLSSLQSPADLLRLQLLEQISLIARQQSKPLLAACAIGRMTKISLAEGRSPLTPFAFVSYAWVASWFCADFRLAQRFSVQGMQLANQFGGLMTRASIGSDLSAAEVLSPSLIDSVEPAPDNTSTEENPAQITIATSAALLQCSQVQHWFAPIHSTREQLQHVAALSQKHGQWLIQGECYLLQHQISLLTTPSLSEQLNLCREHYEQMIKQQQTRQAAQLRDSSLLLMQQLCGEQPLPDKVEYAHGWQAVSTILAAFLLDQQSLWPDLYRWEAQLENELAGYFCVSEALFCTAMMRLILAQQQHSLMHRRRMEVEQIESRFELWAKHCPENFSTQRLLLQAEKARLLNHNPAPLYEQAIINAEQHGFSHHRALCYERYGDYLQSQNQPALAQFCLIKSRDLYYQWGALAKTEQLECLIS
ncbi:AraC family transcriptional regulator ligand-binding domain-containing protein [uncultured Amphritea sp.]|uniref:AraC family transcriptional regulator n=1 Tax=uncultured Amphritea sp. TaxID=981605 RepID=UPI0026028F95|nr:AraC family transcriptional regulator ligand-binding domain-containing protein [uncultured Amphritea sp.]